MLNAGVSVIADSCNSIELTRRAWERVAVDAGAQYVNVEIICSDAQEHRRRVETRVSTIPGLRLPTREDVESREYHDWTMERIVLDTSQRPEAECVDELAARVLGGTP